MISAADVNRRLRPIPCDFSIPKWVLDKLNHISALQWAEGMDWVLLELEKQDHPGEAVVIYGFTGFSGFVPHAQ